MRYLPILAKKRKKKFSLRPKKPPKYVVSDDEDGLSMLPLKRKVSRESSVRTRDDGDDDSYDNRMRYCIKCHSHLVLLATGSIYRILIP